MKIFSIGYGITPTHKSLIAELKKRRIGTLIDCRTHPYSRYNPAFTRPALQTALEHSGIKYTHQEALGGKQEFLGDYKDALKTLKTDAKSKTPPIVLMCSELDPRKCHRFKKIGQDLMTRGVQMTHIDMDDTDWLHPNSSKKQPQLKLFSIGNQIDGLY